MRIAVDIDGVLRDFVGQVRETFLQQYKNEQVSSLDSWVWKMHKNFEIFEHDKKSFEKWLWNDNVAEIMLYAKPFENVVNSFNSLVNDTIHDIVIVSDQRKGTEFFTLEWLGKNGFAAREVLFTSNKLSSNCDIIIDDKKENLQAFSSRGKIAITIARPWNKSWEKTPRFEKFEEAAEFIKTL